VGPIRAGTWHLVGDGILFTSADVRFDVLWRHGGSDTTVLHLEHHFDPPTGANRYEAVPYEADATADAVAAVAGDLLVLRFSSDPGDGGAVTTYLPNGDGAHANGRIPSLTLPH
jgi:hypothetical protein